MTIIQKHLRDCSLQVPAKKGTAYRVSPTLGVTCAHVLPDNVQEQDAFEVRSPEGKSIEARIVTLLNHPDLDLCIFSLPDSGQSFYLVLKDELKRQDPVYGVGFPVYEGIQRGDAFDGFYESTLDPKPGFDYGVHKIGKTQVIQGFSGSAVFNIRTGFCIGMITESRDLRSSLGGFATTASLILNELHKIPEFQQLDTTKMHHFWNGISKQQPDTILPPRPGQLYKRKDEAYTCDRSLFLTRFDEYWQVLPSSVQHYLLIGEARHSPLGVAKKIAYESFTRCYKSDLKYPGDPSAGLPVPLLQAPNNVLQLLKMMYEGYFRESPATYNQKLWQMNETDLIKFLVDQYALDQLSILQMRLVIGDHKEDLEKLLSTIRKFTEALDLEIASRRAPFSFKVLFFWCVEYASSRRDKTTDITREFLRKFSFGELSKKTFIDLIRPTAARNKLQEFIRNTAAQQLYMIPVNHCNALTMPPKTDIIRWMDNIDTEANNEDVIPPALRNIALKTKQTTELEKIFLKIIGNFNEAKNKSWIPN
jgi:hypothetical protein